MNFYRSLKNTVCNVTATAILFASMGAQAQAVWDIANSPLLGGDNQVQPNLIFMFDDSSSMTLFKGTQYPYCMDVYDLGRLRNLKYGSAGYSSWLWRNCSLRGSDMKTPFDLSEYQYYADPSRLSGVYPYRDLRTLATYSSTFNPLYYNPDIRYMPWPGMPDSNPKAARPLATDPTAAENITFNLINNAPLRVKGNGTARYIYYLDESGREVKFPDKFNEVVFTYTAKDDKGKDVVWPRENFQSNTVVAPYIRADNGNGYNVDITNISDFIDGFGYKDPNGDSTSGNDGCFKYDGLTKWYVPVFNWRYEGVLKVSPGSYNNSGGVLHRVFNFITPSIDRPDQDVICTPNDKSYRVYNYTKARNTSTTYTETSPFFIAQYVKFTGDPTNDADVVNMDKYLTVKIDNAATAIPSGNTQYPPDPYVRSAKRTDCKGATKCTLSEEQTNFANWFTYYKTKRGIAIGTVAQAFGNLPQEFRVGWGQLSKGKSSIDGENANYLVQGVRQWDKNIKLIVNGKEKEQSTAKHFNDWIAKMGTSGTTNLRDALQSVGNYFSRTDFAGPWGNTPGDSSDTTSQLTCRRNYQITITDGGWTGDITGAGLWNVDGALPSTPKGLHYIPSKPFSDSYSNTLADFSMYYWAKDLRPDMDDTVNTTSNDPANWQHLTNYYLMLNLSKSISGDSLDNLDPGLRNGTKTWPEPTTDAARIDDTLHAAINSRGRMFHVDGPESVLNAIQKIQDDMTSPRDGSDAQVQVSGQYLSGTSKKFKPTYSTTPWSGNLWAYNFNSDGSVAPEPAWNAADRLGLKQPNDRNIFTLSGSVGTRFSKDVLTRTDPTQTDTDLQNLANYVRGDRSLEGRGYRTRGSALGDIVNSSPILVGSSLDSQYDLYSGAQTVPLEGKSSYLTFLAAKKARTERVFVGANDGMLHAFNANTGDEDFAYIPSTLLDKFSNFASPTYAHRYFVDGQLSELDAYGVVPGDATKRWRNLVVGNTGAGGKTVFAINVPTGAGAAAPAETDIRWEISQAVNGFSELGYTLGKLEAGLMRNGQYAVLINNGYASASGKASLFVVNALTGALIRHIETDVGANSVADKNGLGAVRVIRNAAREIVAAYAGDLKGNMWKFDLSDSDSTKWNLAFSKKPLFQASSAITAAPGLITHPLSGFMVIFGTGKMFEAADPRLAGGRGVIYGIWDKDPVGVSALTSSNNLTNSNSLVEQTLTATNVNQPDGSVKTFYTVSKNKVDYANNRGWFAKLANDERVIYDPQAALGRIYVESVMKSAATGTITCNASGFDLNGYFLDPFTGSYNPARPTLDTSGDGVINGSDSLTVVGYKTPTISRASVTQAKVAGTKGVLVSATDQKVFNGNQALVRRAWRQIVTPP